MESQPDALGAARLFLARSEFARAKDAFLAALFGDRYNLDGMLGLGLAFVGLEDYGAARVVFTQAVARHPGSSDAHSALGGVLLELDDLDGARNAFERALNIDPARRTPWAGLGVAYERSGDIASADHAWREAFREGGPAVLPYRGEGAPLRVLLFRSAVGGNVPFGPVFDNRIYEVNTLFVESFHEAMKLPTHDVAINVVGNADLRTRALDKAEMAARATTAPIINLPLHVRRTGRAEIAERLREVPDVVTPRMRIVPKSGLSDDAGLGWPLLVRAIGFHGGEHFVKVDDPTDLHDAAASLTGDDVLAIEYLETRSDDGMFRKYRMHAIDGRLYPSHLAISLDWKVHYFSAQRGGDLEREEQAFLADPEAAIGGCALRAIESAAAILELDYAGFDFALDAAGRVVIFEANATMRIGTNPAAIDAVRSMIALRAEVTYEGDSA